MKLGVGKKMIESVVSQYETLRNWSLKLVEMLDLQDEIVTCTVLKNDWAKLPSTDYALMKGKEVILHCELCSVYGQAFTDNPAPFKGLLKDVLRLDLRGTRNRAIFFATLNAIAHISGDVPRPIHCKGADAEKCGEMLATYLQARFGNPTVLHIGYQPGHIKALANMFEHVYVTDSNPENVGAVKFGVTVKPACLNEELIRKSDVVCITGSALINGSLFPLVEFCKKHDIPFILYGISAMSAAHLLGYENFCPLSGDKP
jgi:hypothetical protein